MIDWEKILAKHTSDNGLTISRVYKELSNLNRKKIIQLKNGQKTQRNISPKSIYRWQVSTGKDVQHQ